MRNVESPLNRFRTDTLEALLTRGLVENRARRMQWRITDAGRQELP
jgi:hypothetical protein